MSIGGGGGSLHGDDYLKLGLIAAAAIAAPYALGAFGGAGAAGAAGAVGAEAGAGAAAGFGSGLVAADYAALGLGPLAGAGASLLGGEAGLLGGAGAAAEFGSGLTAADYLGTAAGGFGAEPAATGFGGLLGEAASAAPYGGELSSVGDIGGTMLGGAPAQDVTVLPGDWGGPLDVYERIKGLNVQKGLKGWQQAQALQKLAAPPRAQSAGGGQRPQQYQGRGNELAQLMALYSNPTGQARLQALLHKQGLA